MAGEAMLSLMYTLHNQPGRVPPMVHLKEGTASLLLSFRVAFADDEYVDTTVQLETTGMAVITGVQPDNDSIFIRAHIIDLDEKYATVQLAYQDVQLLSAVYGKYTCRVWILDTEFSTDVTEQNFRDYEIVCVQPFICNVHESAWGQHGIHQDVYATITYWSEDGSESLGECTVVNGSYPTYIPEPTKEPSEGYIYVFSGWSHKPYGNPDELILHNVFRNIDVYACFDARKVNLVQYFDEDGVTLLASELVMSGQACQHAPTPTKEPSGGVHFVFSGWAVVPGGSVYPYALYNIYANTNLYAVYEAVENFYTVRYWSENGQALLGSEQVEYGGSAVQAPTPIKPQDAYYTYAFSGWAASVGGSVNPSLLINITSDTNAYAVFASTIRQYAINYFVDGALYSSEMVNAGNDAAQTPSPTKAPTQYVTYSLAGWSATEGGSVDAGLLLNILANTNAYAVWTETARLYTVRYFVDGTVTATEQVEAGEDCEEAPTPTRPSTAYYSFTFTGWAASAGGQVDPAILNDILADKDVYAIFSSAKRYYTVNYYDYDSSSLGNETVEAGFDCIHVPTPTRPSDQQYTYTFDGWATSAGGSVVANATKNILADTSLYACYTATQLAYLVRYFNDDGTTIYSTEYVQPGGDAVNAPTPTKAPDAYGTWTFTGWAATIGGTVNPNILRNINADTDAYAVFALSARTYTVTYDDWDGTFLSSETVTAGQDCQNAPTPTRLHFTFVGWNIDAGGAADPDALENILSDKTLYAIYTMDGLYTVTYDDDDGTFLSSEQVYAGEDCVSAPTPTKPSTPYYSYTFIGWSDTQGGSVVSGILQNIQADKTVYAVYTQTGRTYTVNYYDDDGVTLLSSETVAAGNNCANVPTPTKQETATYVYTFAGWAATVGGQVDASLTQNILADEDIYAVFTATHKWTVSYFDYDGTALVPASEVVLDGGSAQNAPTPTRADDGTYRYTFDGWSDTLGGSVVSGLLTNIQSDVSAYAHYAAVNIWTVTYDDYDGTFLGSEVVVNGGNCANAPTPPARAGYSFDGWSDTQGGAAVTGILNNITASKTVYAAYTASAPKTVSYYMDDGTTLIATEQVPSGGNCQNAPTPTKPSDSDYSYTFDGWSDTVGGTVDPDALIGITADKSLYAHFQAVSLPATRKYLQGTLTTYTNQTITNIGDMAFGASREAGTRTPIAMHLKGVTSLSNSAFALSRLAQYDIGSGTSFEDWIKTYVDAQSSLKTYLFRGADLSVAMNSFEWKSTTKWGNYMFTNLRVNKFIVNGTVAKTSDWKIPEGYMKAFVNKGLTNETNQNTTGIYVEELYLPNYSASPAAKPSSFMAGYGELKVLDYGVVASLPSTPFTTCWILEVLILRNTSGVVTLASGTTIFYSGSPLGQKTGKIYVPSALISAYQADSVWSPYSSCFEAIEGSIYE